MLTVPTVGFVSFVIVPSSDIAYVTPFAVTFIGYVVFSVLIVSVTPVIFCKSAINVSAFVIVSPVLFLSIASCICCFIVFVTLPLPEPEPELDA